MRVRGFCTDGGLTAYPRGLVPLITSIVVIVCVELPMVLHRLDNTSDFVIGLVGPCSPRYHFGLPGETGRNSFV